MGRRFDVDLFRQLGMGLAIRAFGQSRAMNNQARRVGAKPPFDRGEIGQIKSARVRGLICHGGAVAASAAR